MKKIISKPFKSKNNNLICKECKFNCHKNCNFILTIFSNWCYNLISMEISKNVIIVYQCIKNIIYMQKEGE